jgi:hypothetical protein
MENSMDLRNKKARIILDKKPKYWGDGSSYERLIQHRKLLALAKAKEEKIAEKAGAIEKQKELIRLFGADFFPEYYKGESR